MREVWLPLGAFIALIIFVATRHEMWRDEVRAFSVATKAPSWSALASSLHQEGHPILWYAILRIVFAVTHSPLVLPVIALIVGTIAAFLILRYAPFPLWTRLLAVFGVFLGYEYSVVARNYGIGVMLMLVACILFPSRHTRPLPLAVALALMANTSVHATFASLIIACVWLTDVFEPPVRSAFLHRMTAAAFAILLGGIWLALMTARTSPDIAFAFSPGELRVWQVLRVLISDPGWTLNETMQSGVGSVLPWTRIGLSPGGVSRAGADLAILSLAWSLRKNKRCLAGTLLAIFGFEIIFRLVYPGALRHEGILVFLLISLSWLACAWPSATASDRRAASLGLVPLLVAQSLALPVVAGMDFTRPESSSKAFAALIRNNHGLSNAILMSEPDYMMESLPYYVPNPVYMPRQGEFQHRVYFDNGTRRRRSFQLGTLVALADSLSCTSGRPVLIAIAYPRLLKDAAGEAHPAYRGTTFSWNAVERDRLLTRSRFVKSFTGAVTDENYSVFEVAPNGDSTCLARRPE